ncbi:MAG: 5-formyltetrahydrofolate cyclo-ligase [Ruminococcaceae bacterium]|nr:5-formyltetrahydrofolate cyclo-ligase [Oscillospiraceae bacterium]
MAMTKNELRGLLKERRASISPDEKKQLDRAVVESILRSSVYRNADTLLLFAPLTGEVNLLPLVRAARKDGKQVAFPRCDTNANRMAFYLLTPAHRLAPGAYGIPEPPLEAPLCVPTEKTLCLCPALSFDPEGNRLGYGKGYYDRFLAKFPGIRAGVVYTKMMVKRLPTEEYDLPMDLIFTERQPLLCAALRKEGSMPPSTATATEHREAPALQGDRLANLKKVFAKETLARAKESITPPKHPPLLVLGIFALLVIWRLLDPFLTTSENELALAILLQLLIFAATGIAYCYFLKKDLLERLRRRIRLFRPEQLWFLACMLAVMITGSMLLEILTGGIASLVGGFTLYSTFVARMSGGGGWAILVILAYGVLPALCEELIFRGILIHEYEGFGAGVAIGVSALFFALLHFSLPLFPSYLFVGILLACSLFATRSLIAPVLLHLGYNIFCLLGQSFLSAFYINAGSNEIFLFCLISLFLLFSAFAAGEARKIYHLYAIKGADSSYTVSHPTEELPARIFFSLFSPTVAPCIVLWLVMAIINLM